MKEMIVEAKDAGMRLDRWLKVAAPGLPFGQMQKALRAGNIRVDGQKMRDGAAKLEAGQVVKMPEFKAAEHAGPKTPRKISAHEADDLRQLVIYRDREVIAINKPHGLAVQGGSKQSRHLDGMLAALQFDSAEPPRLVHRLDKDTSGLLLLARSREVAAKLMPLFAGKRLEKAYLALVIGVPELETGTIDLRLHKPAAGKVMVDEDEGKKAITDYEVLERLGRKLSLVKLYPRTGRTHQLRVHMAAIGHPIVGDGKYGGAEAFVDGLPKALHLHAWRMEIPEGLSKRLSLLAPLNGPLKESCDQFGLKP